MAKLYVNADDFGLHPAVNDAIAKCVELGSVNSVSVMANGNGRNVSMLREFQDQGIFIGAHLTWVGEPWMTQKHSFFSWKELIQKVVVGGKKFLKEMQVEADEQIWFLLNRGISIHHIDSHQHVHIFPGIWQIALQSQHKYNIDNIRIPSVKNLSLARGNAAGLSLQMLSSLRQSDGGIYCAGIKHAGNYDLAMFGTELKKNSDTDTMLIVHPGNNNEYLKRHYSHWHFDWEKEYAALNDERFLQIVKDNGFTLPRR